MLIITTIRVLFVSKNTLKAYLILNGNIKGVFDHSPFIYMLPLFIWAFVLNTNKTIIYIVLPCLDDSETIYQNIPQIYINIVSLWRSVEHTNFF